MIEIVRGQVDTYYKLRKDGRVTNVKWLQTVLDFLEIGGAAAIAIMNGERAKTIAGIGIGALQAGRTTINKNFEILQTQVLINTMDTNRALIMTEIVANMDKPIVGQRYSDTYSWYAAKNDLRQYLLAGTFDNALTALVKQSGDATANAERGLRIVEKRPTVAEIQAGVLQTGRNAIKIINDLDTDLSDDQKKAAATKTLQAIVSALNKKGGKIKTELDSLHVTDKSEGTKILAAIITIKGRLIDDEQDGETLINIIDQTIIDVFEADNKES